MPSNYWSSTTNAGNSNNAWHVNFNNGNDNNDNKSNSYYVRAVRGGKCSLLSFSSLYAAYLDCRKRKRGTLNALRFEYRLLANLFDLAREIQQGTYHPSRSVCFVTTKPKTREIFAADFRDRIVHHLVVRELEKIMEPKFIHDSYASRVDKGTHAAVRRLQKFMLQATKNRKVPAWYLQLDIRSFFMSIDKDILFGLVERATALLAEEERSALLYLAHRIIFHDCTSDYQFKGDSSMLERVPAHKSLFHAPKNKGLPIGNLTSQFFANVYLNELDQFVKHTLHCRFYLRYVDDFILVSPDREQLVRWQRQIEDFLRERLALESKAGTRLHRVSAGADFLGYIVRPDYLLARRRVVGNLKLRLTAYAGQIVETIQVRGRTVTRVNVASEAVSGLRQTLASYLGHLRHASTHDLMQSLFVRFSWLNYLFFLDNYRLYDRFRHQGVFRTFRSQVRFFHSRLDGFVTLFRVGRFIECYGQNAQDAADLCKLRLFPEKRGVKQCAGFPVCQLDAILAKVIAAGRNVAIVEQGEPGRYVQDRHVCQMVMNG